MTEKLLKTKWNFK